MRPAPRTLTLLVALAVMAWAGPARGAEEYEVRAYVEPEGPITDTQPVRLVIQVEGREVPGLSVPKLPALENLKVVGGPNTNQSTFFQFDGTRTKRVVTKSLTFTLLAESPGEAEIPPIAVKVGSKTHRTETIRLQVRSGPTGRSPPPGPGEASSDRGDESLPVFVEARLGSEEVWVGESLSLDVTLYAALQVGNFNWLEAPSFTNFWVEDLTVDPSGEAYRTNIEGRRYTAYPVVRKILVPTTAGEFELSPYTAQIQMRRSTGDLFRDFFSSSRFRNLIRKTEPLKIHVKSLPEEGRPDEFTGAVGSFRLRVSLDRESARVNDAVALQATVEGTGSLQSAPAPLLDASPDLKVFEPKVHQSSEHRGGDLRSRKTWEWILVPLTPGEIAAPTLGFSYFDPSTGAYRVLQNEPQHLTVERGDPQGETTVAQGDVRLQRREIAFIKPLRGNLADHGSRVHQRSWYLVLLFLPVALSPVVILVGRKRVRFLRDHGLARARRARVRAKRRLRSTGRRTGHLEAGVFHDEVARALVEYIADRFNRSGSGLTYDLADDLLESSRVDPELRNRVRSTLETCDFARYVPTSAEAGRKAQVLKEASKLVDLLEKALS